MDGMECVTVMFLYFVLDWNWNFIFFSVLKHFKRKSVKNIPFDSFNLSSNEMKKLEFVRFCFRNQLQFYVESGI